MPDDTTILALPLILPAQAQKHVTHNEALVALDLIVQLAVINRTLTAPPALPSVGDRHIVASGAVGDWVGQVGRIALYSATGWQFTAPLAGWRAHVLAEGATAVFDGLVWKTPAESPLSVPQLGVAATADATNRLTVSAPATLLNHAGGGHQLKLNKAASGDTASLLFQTGFSGRAEMGTAGTDDFAVKVSADGAVWATALQAAAATGELTLPKPLHLGGQSADPVAPTDGTLWLNTTTGEIKVRSGGVTLPVGGGVTDGDKGDITVSGGGASFSIDAGVVGLTKLANLATGAVIGRASAGSGVPEALTGAQVTALLGTFTSGAKGVVPASGGGTTNFLRADGTFAAPAGGAAPAGVDGDLQTKSGSGFAAPSGVTTEGGQLRLPSIAAPAAPAAGGVKAFGTALLGPDLPAFMRPDGKVIPIQADMGLFNVARYLAIGNGGGFTSDGVVVPAFTGTSTTLNVGATNLFTMLRRQGVQVTTAATTAVVGIRGNANLWRVGRSAAAPGGFAARMKWGPSLGAATATTRAFVGLMPTAAPTDVEPSSRVNICGMGWDAADTNIQFMHNDGAGTATKIDLGAGFPVPTTNETHVYELQLFSPNSLTQSVYYRVIRYSTDDNTIAAEASGTVTTDLPAVATFLAPMVSMSVGGTSSVIGLALFGFQVGTDY